MMANESQISPWVRPVLLIWVAFMAFGVSLIAGFIDIMSPGVGVRFGETTMKVLANVPQWVPITLQTLFGFYAVGKSGEKIVQHWKGPLTEEEELS